MQSPERDGRISEIENIYAQHLLELGRPAGAPDRLALPVAGDDPAAKKVVIQLIDELGFDPVDAGTLDESWRQQPGTPVYGADLNAQGVRRALEAGKQQAGPAVPSHSEKPRDVCQARMM